MSKRASERLIKRKRILDILREGPKTTSQILNLTGYSKATVIRILHEFEMLKLIKKMEGLWYWHEYSREFANAKEYEIMLEHSRGLIPGFQSLLKSVLGIKEKHEEKNLKLQYYAEQHLRTGYPEVYYKLMELRNADKKAKETIVKYLAILEDKRLCFLQGKLIEIKPLYPGVFAMTFAAIPGITAKTEEEALKYQKVMREIADIVKEEESKLLQIYKHLSDEVYTIILETEHGSPLLGKCNACPKIKVKE
ncbi:hypothetical protein DRO19_00325 [Candidatus Bathyarchaeota archaeon]|nr:MAG: hypothetical protein DRO19_00325 [Candidatus Bathyarchaeota archaeon]